MNDNIPKIIVVVGAALALAGCQTDKDYVRGEMIESRAYIQKQCGADQRCREHLALAEANRIGADLHERAARRERFAAAMRQMSENQARIAAAQAAQPVYRPPIMRAPVMTNCQRTMNGGMNCQSY